MIKLSNFEAFQGMDEIDMTVYEDELYLCFESDQRKGRKQSQQFYLDDKNNIVLYIYWNNKKVHTVFFDNKAKLTEVAIKLLEEK